MRHVIGSALLACVLVGTSPAVSQVKMTRDQVLFYTSDWKGDRFPDGRPKLPDALLKRAVDISIEDIWDFLRAKGYQNQFEGGWQALHIEKPFAGRALTAQYMPIRPDMAKAIAAEGKAEGRPRMARRRSTCPACRDRQLLIRPRVVRFLIVADRRKTRA